MPVNPVSSSETPTYVRDTSKDNPESKISTETFLKLLVAQLKYQDPLEPQKDTAFVTQMAQMTSLQEMQQMNASLQNAQAFNMIGKEIFASVFDKETHKTKDYVGIVDSVFIKDGIPYVVVGDQAINISDVKQVFPAPAEDTTPDTPADTPPPAGNTA